MKRSILVYVFFFLATALFAQNSKEAVISNLDNLEREAVLKGDSTALFTKYWSPMMVVNTPANRVGTVEGTKMALKTGKLDYARFDREVEKITFIENIAVVMGQETLEPQGVSDNAGKTITRRFTNVWMDTKEGWRIVARQATIIKVE